MDDTNGVDVERNAFWLLGVEDDFYTIQQIKVSFGSHWDTMTFVSFLVNFNINL